MAIRCLDHVNFLTNDSDATIQFYCEVIGLKLGDPMSIDTAQTLYFYIDGSSQPILHVGQAHINPDTNKFIRKASLTSDTTKGFSTGSFDHFCLMIDFIDYEVYIDNLNKHGIEFQTYCHSDINMKQIWALDPNGVRVELNFVDT